MAGYSAISVAADQAYLQELVQRAHEHRLADRPEWHALLHYEPRLLLPGVNSLVDAPNFFNAPSGKTDPHAELEATLARFFSVANGKEDRHPQCAFVARYAWLKQALSFDGKKLPEQRCPRFERWYSRLDPRQLSLVFASAYLNNPASMFGHTLLRIDAEGQDEGTRLLAYAVNYAANADQERGLSFAINGVFGGYPGRFSVAPYYRKVKEYGDIENRDLWEYQLNFSREEVDRVLKHLWELRLVHFDYFFFDENCSYHLLSLLEVARPGLRLTDQFRWLAVPTDTLRAVTESAGLLQGVRFRPARSTILRHRLTLMEENRQELAQQLAAGRVAPESGPVRRLPPREQARVLELAVDELAYREASKPQPSERAKRLTLGLLKARNKLDVPDQTPVIPVPKARPDQGHESARAGFGYGYEEPRHYAQLEFRPAYHDLMDPEEGYPRGAQVQFLNLALRLYPVDQDVELERLDAVDVVSLSPWNRFMKPFSWKVNLGVARKRFDGGDRSLVGHLRPGIGLSYELTERSLIYAFADGGLELSNRFDQLFAVGIGPSFGMIHDVSERWRMGLSARLQHYLLGEPTDLHEITLGQRVTLTKQSALRFDLSWTREIGANFIGANASLLLYF